MMKGFFQAWVILSVAVAVAWKFFDMWSTASVMIKAYDAGKNGMTIEGNPASYWAFTTFGFTNGFVFELVVFCLITLAVSGIFWYLIDWWYQEIPRPVVGLR